MASVREQADTLHAHQLRFASVVSSRKRGVVEGVVDGIDVADFDPYYNNRLNGNEGMVGAYSTLEDDAEPAARETTRYKDCCRHGDGHDHPYKDVRRCRGRLIAPNRRLNIVMVVLKFAQS